MRSDADGRFTFTIPAVSVVDAANAAPAFVGPLETRAENAELTVQLRAFAEVTCRVVQADGNPARRATVAAIPKERVPGVAHGLPLRTDDDGAAPLPRLAPGTYELAVLDGVRKVTSVEAELLSGPNPDVVLRLPN